MHASILSGSIHDEVLDFDKLAIQAMIAATPGERSFLLRWDAPDAHGSGSTNA
jgi:hypothetical protein